MGFLAPVIEIPSGIGVNIILNQPQGFYFWEEGFQGIDLVLQRTRDRLLDAAGVDVRIPGAGGSDTVALVLSNAGWYYREEAEELMEIVCLLRVRTGQLFQLGHILSGDTSHQLGNGFFVAKHFGGEVKLFHMAYC